MTDPYTEKPWIPPFHIPPEQRTKQEVPCMSIPTPSKPPEETPTPSTVSLPSYQEWLDILEDALPIDLKDSHLRLMAEKMERWLAQRGSPR